jgi:hypothetical protein
MTWLLSGAVHLSKVSQRIFKHMFCPVYVECTCECTGIAIKGLNPEKKNRARIIFSFKSQAQKSGATPNYNEYIRLTNLLSRECGSVFPSAV